jgi:hypothetical protein
MKKEIKNKAGHEKHRLCFRFLIITRQGRRRFAELAADAHCSVDRHFHHAATVKEADEIGGERLRG